MNGREILSVARERKRIWWEESSICIQCRCCIAPGTLQPWQIASLKAEVLVITSQTVRQIYVRASSSFFFYLFSYTLRGRCWHYFFFSFSIFMYVSFNGFLSNGDWVYFPSVLSLCNLITSYIFFFSFSKLSCVNFSQCYIHVTYFFFFNDRFCDLLHRQKILCNVSCNPVQGTIIIIFFHNEKTVHQTYYMYILHFIFVPARLFFFSQAKITLYLTTSTRAGIDRIRYNVYLYVYIYIYRRQLAYFVDLLLAYIFFFFFR